MNGSFTAARGVVWLLDGLDAEPRPVELRLGSVPAGRAPRLISADDHVGSLSVDATGRASAVEVRGTVHWLTHRDGPALALSVTPGTARARLPEVLGRDGQVVWVTDADGEDALEVGSAAADGAPQAPRRLAAGAIGQVSSLAAAPDGSKVAVAARDGHLRVVEVASGAVSELAASDNGEVTGLAWSTDSAWLAWSHPDSQPLRRLRLARVAGQAPAQVTDVTDGRFTDTEPVFTIDGKYLAFLSKRSFDPVYDAHFFDLAFPFGARPYLIPLAAATLSPFGPQPGGRSIGDPDDESDDSAGSGDGGSDSASGGQGDGDAAEKDGRAEGGGKGRKAPAPVAVDLAGLADRIAALPVPESRYSSLRAVKGGLAWLCEPLTGALGEGGARPGDSGPRPALQRFDFARQSVTVLEEDVDWFEASGDGTRLVVSDDDSLDVLPADRKADSDNPDDRVSIDASRARFLADPAALWQHAFAEAGRLIRHDFWVPDLAGVDWDAVLAQYRPRLDQVASSEEFADVLYETLGELGTSHAYVLPAPRDNGSARQHRGRPARRRPGARRRGPLGRAPDRPRRDVRPAGPVPAQRARRPGPAGRPAAGRRRPPGGGRRPRPAAGRLGGQAGRADRDQPGNRRHPASRGGAAGQRAAAALPGLGGQPAGRGPGAWPRPDRLPARAGHGQRGLGRLPPRPARRDDPRRAHRRRPRQPRRAHLPARDREAGPAGHRLGDAQEPAPDVVSASTPRAGRWSRWPTSSPARTATSSPGASARSGWARWSGPGPGAAWSASTGGTSWSTAPG